MEFQPVLEKPDDIPYSILYLTTLDGTASNKLRDDILHSKSPTDYSWRLHWHRYAWGAWVRHESDLRALTEKHPTEILVLDAFTRDGAQVWKKYFNAGKMQFAPAVVSFSKFDKTKLDKG